MSKQFKSGKKNLTNSTITQAKLFYIIIQMIKKTLLAIKTWFLSKREVPVQNVEIDEKTFLKFAYKEAFKIVQRDINENRWPTRLQKLLKLAIVGICAFLAQYSTKNTTQAVFCVIFSYLNIPNYLLVLTQQCNFNVVLSFLLFITNGSEPGIYNNLMVLIPQMFLIHQYLAFFLPVLVFFVCRYAVARGRSRIRELLINLFFLISQVLYVIHKLNLPRVMQPTAEYIMDRAKIQLYSAYDDYITGQFDVIKVHEEIETPKVKSEESGAPDQGYGLKTTQNDKKENTKTTSRTEGKSEKTIEEIKDSSLEEGATKKFRREMDSFLKHNDLVRLLHIPTGLYMASTEEKIDNKFYKTEFYDQNTSSFHLWRVILPKREEFLRSGRFFSLKNAHTGLTLGIRSDGVLNCSHEGRKSRQKFIVKDCENHSYYKNVQDKPENLIRARSETTILEKHVEYNLGFEPNFLSAFGFLSLLIFHLFNLILHLRFKVRLLLDKKMVQITIFTGLLAFLEEQSYFNSGILLIVLRMSTNAIL
ncbi:putative transporter [Pseudoloma neurophilia]|uniref:Putative transporter n=1 Tax=Pseudoloma neurophilia TaxID=146866 RepID=A0A0R0M4S0_9MICR|nr:putative transporter [Pseudoloma neurophilia]